MSLARDLGEEGGSYEVPRPDGTQANANSDCYPVFTIEQLLAQPMVLWLVKNVIRLGELVLFSGDPSAGKTFLLLDIALKIAAAMTWWGHRVMPGSVLYLAGEGSGGLKNRIRAWGIEHNVDVTTLPFAAIPHAIAFQSDDEFERLMRTIAAIEPKPVMVVIDTLARYTAGCDENSAQHMGLFVRRCDRIKSETGAAVVVVHHNNRAGTGERGSSALRGAMDVMIDVSREGDTVILTGKKSKDGEVLPELRLESKQIKLGTDEDGDPITSCVLVQASPPPPASVIESIERMITPALPTIEENAQQVRERLATVFGGGPVAGGALFNASGLARRAHYAAFNAELAAKRIEIVGKGRYPKYRLTPLAPEFRSSSSGESANSAPNSQQADAGPIEFESEFAAPLEGATANSDSNSPDDSACVIDRESESEFTDIPRGGGNSNSNSPAAEAPKPPRKPRKRRRASPTASKPSESAPPAAEGATDA